MRDKEYFLARIAAEREAAERATSEEGRISSSPNFMRSRWRAAARRSRCLPKKTDGRHCLTKASLARFASLANARRVARYNVYSIDDHGAISGERTIDAVSDDEAIFAVRSMQRPLETQIWVGDRRIATILPYRAAATD